MKPHYRLTMQRSSHEMISKDSCLSLSFSTLFVYSYVYVYSAFYGIANFHFQKIDHKTLYNTLVKCSIPLIFGTMCLLTLILLRKCLVCYKFKLLQSHSTLVNILSEYQTVWIRVKHQVTRRLIRIQAVWIWHLSCEKRAKG